MIHTGDCLEVMATMPDASVDAIVTDPPYGLEFMGKGWDGADGFRRSLNPADAGRDSVFGRTSRTSPEYRTFPMRLRAEHDAVNTGVAKQGGRQRRGLGYQQRQARDARTYQEWTAAWAAEAWRIARPGAYLLAFGGTRTHHRLTSGIEDAGWIIRDELDWIYASGFPKGKANLKPAHEPIVMARKPGPLQPLAIDECRIATSPSDAAAMERANTPGSGRFAAGRSVVGALGRSKGGAPLDTSTGRWPSNVLLSDPELFDEPNPYVVGSGATDAGGSGRASGPTLEGPLAAGVAFGARLGTDVPAPFYGDTGGYSRFFIVPKADRAEREPLVRGQLEAGKVGGRNRADGRQWDIPGSTVANGKPDRENVHPTVKPVDLMRHLVRLVTPTGGTVLDPFLGSGSTAIAAELEGFAWTGIEKEPEYVAIAEARLNGTQRGMGLVG